MVSSPNYDRVKDLLHLGEQPQGAQDTEERTISTKVRSSFNDVKGKSEDFQRDLSVGHSQTKQSADEWMAGFGADMKLHMGKIRTSKAHHETLRITMAGLVAQGGSLSPVLIEPSLEHLRHSSETVTIPVDMRSQFGGAVEATGQAYIAALERQKNKEREDAAQAILDQLNEAGESHASRIQESIPDPYQESEQDPGGDRGPGPLPGQPRRNAGSPPPLGGGGGVGVSGGGSGVNGWVRPSGDELGSVSNPITDPEDLSHIDLTRSPINARMTPNGPVGGHMPADVLNVDDPAWRAPAPTGGGARIAGGTLVAGTAAGAAGGLLYRGGGGGHIVGMPAGTSLRPAAPAGGVLRPTTMPGGAAGVAGQGRAGGAGGPAVLGRGGVNGAVGTGSGAAGPRGGAGAAGRGGIVGTGGQSGARGGSSGVAGRGGAGGGRGAAGSLRGGSGGRGGLAGLGSSSGRGDKKKETQRRNYDVVRIDGIEEQSSGNVGGGAGSADQLKPLSRDSGEDW